MTANRGKIVPKWVQTALNMSSSVSGSSSGVQVPVTPDTTSPAVGRNLQQAFNLATPQGMQVEPEEPAPAVPTRKRPPFVPGKKSVSQTIRAACLETPKEPPSMTRLMEKKKRP